MFDEIKQLHLDLVRATGRDLYSHLRAGGSRRSTATLSFIAERSGDDRAFAYIERIRAFCMSFADYPERGTKREDLLPGLRLIGFERRVAIALHIDAGAITLDRILYGGRDLGTVPGPS